MSAVPTDLLPQESYGESVADGKRIVRDSTGITVEDVDAGPRIPSKGDFDENLAEIMDKSARSTLAQRLMDYRDVDETSRKDWKRLEENGMILMGLSEPLKDAKDSASVRSPGNAQVKIPLMLEAATHFQARSIAELFPATGPMKGAVIGDRTPQKVAQADRVEEFGNYYLTQVDDGYFPDTDQMLLYLPFSGSALRKGSQNWLTGMPELRYIKATNFIAPYIAKDLRSANRYCHTYNLSGQDIRKAKELGTFADIPLARGSKLVALNPKTEDQSDSRTPSEHEDDDTYPIIEYHIDLELDIDPMGQRKRKKVVQMGQKQTTQDLLPYIVIVEEATREILMIRRNWKEKDSKRRKRIWFAHHKFFPGLGFYGWGYPHVISTLQKGANDGINALLDSAFAANFQGGFVTKEGKAASLAGELDLEHGKWKPVGGTFEELSKALYTPPFKEPSPALGHLVEQLLQVGQRFSSVTEASTGNADNRGPVGTTLALIEQSNVVPTSIHKRLHQSLGVELKMWAELVYDFMPNNYPYKQGGEEKTMLKSDFDGRVDVVPVSDPNIWSQKQRIALCQGTLELQNQAPDLYSINKRVEAHRRMMEAMRIPDIDAVGPEAPKQLYVDPIAENGMILVGVPVRAWETQDHEAHLKVHAHCQQMLMASPNFQNMQPEKQQAVLSAYDNHNAEHMALFYRRLVFQQAGIPAPPIGEDGLEQNLPPDVEAQVTAAVVQHLPQLQPPQAQPQPGADQAAAVQAKTQADVQAKDTQSKAQIERDTEAFVAEEARKEHAFQAEQARQDRLIQHEIDTRTNMVSAEETRKDTQVATQLVRDDAKSRLKQRMDAHAADLKLRTNRALADQKHRHTERAAQQGKQVAAEQHDQQLEQAEGQHEQQLEHGETAHEQEMDQAAEAAKAQAAAAKKSSAE